MSHRMPRSRHKAKLLIRRANQAQRISAYALRGAYGLFDNSEKYNNQSLREIRARNGVGRSKAQAKATARSQAG